MGFLHLYDFFIVSGICKAESASVSETERYYTTPSLGLRTPSCAINANIVPFNLTESLEISVNKNGVSRNLYK